MTITITCRATEASTCNVHGKDALIRAKAALDEAEDKVRALGKVKNRTLRSSSQFLALFAETREAFAAQEEAGMDYFSTAEGFTELQALAAEESELFAGVYKGKLVEAKARADAREKINFNVENKFHVDKVRFIPVIMNHPLYDAFPDGIEQMFSVTDNGRQVGYLFTEDSARQYWAWSLSFNEAKKSVTFTSATRREAAAQLVESKNEEQEFLFTNWLQ